MTDPFPPKPNAHLQLSADVSPAPVGGPQKLVVHHAFPVRRPDSDLNEFLVPVRASVLKRSRERLRAIAEPTFPWHEGALSLGALFIGAWLGALSTDVPSGSAWEFTLRTAFPCIGTSSVVAWFFLRKKSGEESAVQATELLKELPDPKETSDTGEVKK